MQAWLQGRSQRLQGLLRCLPVLAAVPVSVAAVPVSVAAVPVSVAGCLR